MLLTVGMHTMYRIGSSSRVRILLKLSIIYCDKCSNFDLQIPMIILSG